MYSMAGIREAVDSFFRIDSVGDSIVKVGWLYICRFKYKHLKQGLKLMDLGSRL